MGVKLYLTSHITKEPSCFNNMCCINTLIITITSHITTQ